MWKTYGSRFLAAIRLTRRERWATFSIALLSVVAIGVGLVNPPIGPLAHNAGITPATVTSVISVFILVISLIESSSQTSVRALKLHESAIAISEVHTRLQRALVTSKASKEPNWTEYGKIQSDYEMQIRECPYNHESIDFEAFRANHRRSPEFAVVPNNAGMGDIAALWAKVRYIGSSIWLPLASWAVVLAALLIAFDGRMLFCGSTL